MTVWRFDQGRLDYFQFDEIKCIAKALTTLDGIVKPSSPNEDLIRITLREFSSLPFLPNDYYVWRNYKRVFGCLLLASDINNRIYASEICKKLADDAADINVEDYLAHIARNFYYPSPIFEGYNTEDQQVFPIIAIIKFLIAQAVTKSIYKVSVEDIGKYLIGNNVTGLEPLAVYQALGKTDHVLVGDQIRQLRELLRFISQFSFLKWSSPELYLEVSSSSELYEIEKALQPIVNVRNRDAGAEILQMGGGFIPDILNTITLMQVESIEEEFTEGKKTRVTHLRTERSGKLKELYFQRVSAPQICTMCNLDTSVRYPWSAHTIELHHLLPLSSPLRVESGTTSLKDMVGLCPTCHRATHKYYSGWLRDNKLKDFRSYEEAKAIYFDAKNRVVLV